MFVNTCATRHLGVAKNRCGIVGVAPDVWVWNMMVGWHMTVGVVHDGGCGI